MLRQHREIAGGQANASPATGSRRNSSVHMWSSASWSVRTIRECSRSERRSKEFNAVLCSIIQSGFVKQRLCPCAKLFITGDKKRSLQIIDGKDGVSVKLIGNQFVVVGLLSQ